MVGFHKKTHTLNLLKEGYYRQNLISIDQLASAEMSFASVYDASDDDDNPMPTL